MRDVLALCYHAVSEHWSAGFAIRPESLRRQLSDLVDHGYEGATFYDAVVGAGREKALVVTFDDSFRSVFELAAPILGELNLPGTVFVPTAYVGTERPMSWPGIDNWVGGPHERELLPMSWDELGELAGRGWEIGSHTRTHPRLPGLDQAGLTEELEGSRQQCEQHLGAPCRSIAYPYGDWSPAVVDATQAAGYGAAGAMAGRVRTPSSLLWPRIGIYRNDSGARFRLKVSHAMRRRTSRAWRARYFVRRLRSARTRTSRSRSTRRRVG